MKDVIILAGGLGTRLSSTIGQVPKSMADIAGLPFLSYQLNFLRNQGFSKVILSVGYLNEQIINYFGFEWKGLTIEYSVESEPLGTGGAIKKAIALSKDSDVYILNGDTLFLVGFGHMFDLHNKSHADVTLALRHVPDSGRYGSISLDDSSKILEFSEKDPDAGDGLVNGGIYLINRKWFDEKSKSLPEKFSLEKDLFTLQCKSGNFIGLEFDGYFLDIGIPADYQKAWIEFPTLKEIQGENS